MQRRRIGRGETICERRHRPHRQRARHERVPLARRPQVCRSASSPSPQGRYQLHRSQPQTVGHAFCSGKATGSPGPLDPTRCPVPERFGQELVGVGDELLRDDPPRVSPLGTATSGSGQTPWSAVRATTQRSLPTRSSKRASNRAIVSSARSRPSKTSCESGPQQWPRTSVQQKLRHKRSGRSPPPGPSASIRSSASSSESSFPNGEL